MASKALRAPPPDRAVSFLDLSTDAYFVIMPALIVLSTGREPGVYKRIKPRRFLQAHSVRDVFPSGFPSCILLDTSVAVSCPYRFDCDVCCERSCIRDNNNDDSAATTF